MTKPKPPAKAGGTSGVRKTPATHKKVEVFLERQGLVERWSRVLDLKNAVFYGLELTDEQRYELVQVLEWVDDILGSGMRAPGRPTSWLLLKAAEKMAVIMSQYGVTQEVAAARALSSWPAEKRDRVDVVIKVYQREKRKGAYDHAHLTMLHGCPEEWGSPLSWEEREKKLGGS